jgi:hypothetical protein
MPFPGLQCGSISSAVLVQVKGRQRSFQPATKVPMPVMRFLTEVKLPQRMACRVMTEKKTSAMFSHDPDVGVKMQDLRLAEPGNYRGLSRMVGSGVANTSVYRKLIRTEGGASSAGLAPGLGLRPGLSAEPLRIVLVTLTFEVAGAGCP